MLQGASCCASDLSSAWVPGVPRCCMVSMAVSITCFRAELSPSARRPDLAVAHEVDDISGVHG